MLEEARCPPEERFLTVIGRYSPAATAKAVAAVRDYFSRERRRFDDASAAATEEFLLWAPALRGAVLQTAYCHADVARGRAFDLAFDLGRPDRTEPTLAVVQFNVIWGRVASAGLVHGWHQAAFFDFPDGPPELVASLPVDAFEPRPGVALCDAENWLEIAVGLEAAERRRGARHG